MKFQKVLLFTVIALSMVLSACAPAKSDTAMTDKPTAVVVMVKSTEEMMEKPAEEMMEKPTEAMNDSTDATDKEMHATPTMDAMMAESTTAVMMETPAWFGTTLTNVINGETFTINDFKGKLILVETMAQWCPTCKKQQLQVKTLLEQLGMPADLIIIALDIDPNENGDTLKTYATGNGFDWIYAVVPADVSREIGNLYGDQFLNPPSTPILIIDQKGEAHPLPFGLKNAEELMKAIEPYLKGM